MNSLSIANVESASPVKKTKRILQLCHGYELPFVDVARQWAALFLNSEYKVTTVFLTGKKSDEVVSQVNSDEVVFLENSSKSLRGLKLKQIRQVRKLLARHDYEFAIAHRYKALYILSHMNLPVLGVHHAFGVYKRWTRRWHISRKCKNLTLLAVSDAVRDDIRLSLPDFDSNKIQTFYNRVDYPALKAALLPREEAREKLNLKPNDFVYGNVGRLHPDKDQTTLITGFVDVAKNQPDAKLVIIGTGRLERSLKELVVRYGLQNRVIFLGKVACASKYFSAFDCFVLTSDHEPFGMVLLEAMAAGLPIIYSDCGGAVEVVADAGFRFTVRDETSLSKKMESVRELSPMQKANIVEKMDSRIKRLFCDEAVTKSFWKLPFFNKTSIS